MTQAPTPGPLDSESVTLLVKGDLLRGPDGSVFKFDRPYEAIDYHDRNGAYLQRADGTEFVLKDGGGPKSQWFANLTFIGRPDADGWMPWSGGENPVPGQAVEVRLRNGHEYEGYSSEQWSADWTGPEDYWKHGEGLPDLEIIAFRLAPTAPVEASGSEREEDALEALNWIENVFPSQGDTNDQGVTVRGWQRLDQACATIRTALSRPQPSGETRALLERIAAVRARKDFTPQQANAGLLTVLDDCAAALALEGQQEDWRCPDCGAQADEWFDCCKNPARAEAQDEGVAGEQTDNAFKIASDLHAAYEQLIYGLPKYLEAENLTDEENMIREAYITLDVTAHRLAAVSDAHPSPTPAADADRVRAALTDLVTWFDKPVQGERGMVWVIRAGDQGADDAVAEALAALKSEGE